MRDKRLIRLTIAALPRPMNAQEAAMREALFLKGFEKVPGFCQRLQRQVDEAVFDKRFSRLHKASAKLTGLAMASDGYALPPGAAPQVGDLYYWLHTNAGFGHVARLIQGNWLAQNSTACFDGLDARGIRHISEHKPPDLIIRLR